MEGTVSLSQIYSTQGYIPIVAVVFVIGFGYYTTTFIFMEELWVLKSSNGLLNILVFTCSIVMCVVSFLYCLFRDSGRPPFDYVSKMSEEDLSEQGLKKNDELAWAVAWLYKATHKRRYLDYVTKNVPISLAKKEPNPVRNTAEFGWDNKRSGIYVLMAKELMSSSFASDTFVFQENADGFVCGVLPESQTRVVNYSRGGLIYKGMGSNMQNPTAISLLLLVYSHYLKHTNHIVHCGHKRATPDRLIALAKSQVDYILGKNPLKMSYMVRYGNKFPQKIHHRGSSSPSIDQHPQKLGCNDGTPYFESILPNPNVLVGAVVGGPALNDTYADSRSMFIQSEPTTYINAPLVGPLAFFSSPKRRNMD